MQDSPRQLRLLMGDKSWTQEEVASRAGVSQSAVCRMLAKAPKRAGKQQKRLLKFLDESGYSRAKNSSRTEARVSEAFLKVWDGSDAHADAVIEILTRLPTLQLRGRGDGGQE